MIHTSATELCKCFQMKISLLLLDGRVRSGNLKVALACTTFPIHKDEACYAAI